VLITEVPGGGIEQTWHPPMATRIAQAVCLGLVTALPGLWLALTLVTNQVPDGGWIALALAVAAWGVLAWRVLAQSVTLTPDTLVIRDILATRQVPLAGITAAGFRRGGLTVTWEHGAARSEQLAINAVNLGPSRWSGLRSDADEIAEAITGAAGLPPLPPRREIVGRNRAWVMLLAAALCLGFGLYYGPLSLLDGSSQSIHSRPFALSLLGAVLFPTGAAMVGLAFRITRDHRRKHRRQAADE
jgi:hypothetical protein